MYLYVHQVKLVTYEVKAEAQDRVSKCQSRLLTNFWFVLQPSSLLSSHERQKELLGH